jgi:hypothetical protein
MNSDVSNAAGHGESGVPPTVLDGNAAAGEFAGVFAGDATAVTVRCGGCGATQPFAELRAYMGGPGTVLCCRRCEAMVARVARTPRGTWLDISGSSSWLFPTTPELA